MRLILLLTLMPLLAFSQIKILTVRFESEKVIEYRTASIEFYRRIAENGDDQPNMYIPVEQIFPKGATAAYIDGVFVQYNIVDKKVVVVDTPCKFYSVNFRSQKVTLIESNDTWIRPTDIESRIRVKVLTLIESNDTWIRPTDIESRIRVKVQ